MEIKAEDFAAAIMDELQAYADVVEETMQDAVKQTAKEGRKKVQQEASGAGFGGTGEYIKSWRAKVNTKHGKAEGTIYSQAPHYRLTHLLEYGHAKTNGGRVRAFPHIKKAEEWAKANMEKMLREALEQ